MTKEELKQKIGAIIEEAGGGFGDKAHGDAFMEESAAGGELIIYTGLKRKTRTERSTLVRTEKL